MSRNRAEANLNRLQEELRTYLVKNQIEWTDARTSPEAGVAQSLFLAHSTSDLNFVTICSNGERLLSPLSLDSRGIKLLKADAVEKALGTEDFVFLYAAPFSFPSSGCGLLFGKSLEYQHLADGFATPFDSGALLNHYQRADMSETPRDFFLRHELPLPEHRDFLQNCLHFLFDSPGNYLDGIAPKHCGPLGLTGGDERRWTHEIRIPKEVVVRSSHLKAIFVPRRLGLEPEIKELLKWCYSEGYDVEIFESDRANDFAKLRKACIEYLRRELK